MKFSFPSQLLLILIVSLVVAFSLLDRILVSTIGIGAVLMSLNAFVGYWTIEKSFQKSNNDFLKNIFGGMALRFFVLAIILVALIKVFHIEIFTLLFTMLFYYIVFTVLEIIYLQKKLASQQ